MVHIILKIRVHIKFMGNSLSVQQTNACTFELRSVAASDIKANVKLSFEDDFRSGSLFYCVS